MLPVKLLVQASDECKIFSSVIFIRYCNGKKIDSEVRYLASILSSPTN